MTMKINNRQDRTLAERFTKMRGENNGLHYWSQIISEWHKISHPGKDSRKKVTL